MTNIREKKHRLPRDCYRGRVAVAITVCIDQRRAPFVEADTVTAFVAKLTEVATKNHCSVLIYCFMPDHVHLIIHGIDDAADAWQAMVDFKQKTGFWFARQHPEFCWQKDFHDHVIRADEDLGAQIRYIANNPVRKGLVSHWQEYAFTGSIGVNLKEIMADTATL